MIQRLGAACAAFVLAAYAGSAALAAPPASGSLYITTLPAAADVWIDGSYVGHSPILLDALGLGRHTVTVTKTGWTSQDVPVSVGGRVALSTVVLQHGPLGYPKTPGFLVVHGATGTIFVDGSPRESDQRGQIALAPGPHTIVMRGTRGKMTRAVSIYPEMRTDVLVRADVTVEDGPASVVAPAEDYLADGEYKVTGTRLAIHHAGHIVLGRIGESVYTLDGHDVSYGSGPTLLGTKLYLPLALLEKIAGTKDH